MLAGLFYLKQGTSLTQANTICGSATISPSEPIYFIRPALGSPGTRSARHPYLPRPLSTLPVSLSHLNAILRSSLLRETPKKVSLAEELMTVRSYLALQQIRFSDRLQVRFNTSPDVMETLVPNFLLQPLVEMLFTMALHPSARAASSKSRCTARGRCFAFE